jgi:phospholipase C
VHGPNGFYRQFAGTGPDITAVPSGARLRLPIANRSSAAVRLTLTSAYGSERSQLTVPPRSTVPFPAPTAFGTGWYDLSVTSTASPGYLRRLAGHVETGRPSISDPALGRS